MLEKFAVTLFEENVQHCLFKRRIRRVTVRFPVAIDQINFGAAPYRLAAVYPNRSIAKIRSGFTIPGTELDDVDLVAGSRDKMFTEIPSKRARLQLQLARNSLRLEERLFMDARRLAQLRISIG